jgi:hypothetical protein
MSSRKKESRAKLPWGERFRFILSPTTTPGVDVSILIALGECIDTLSRGDGFENELSGIVLFPIIAAPEIYMQKDSVIYKRAERSFFVGRNIDYKRWVRARTPGRLKLAEDNFEASIMAIPEKNFSTQSKLRLITILEIAIESSKK